MTSDETGNQTPPGYKVIVNPPDERGFRSADLEPPLPDALTFLTRKAAPQLKAPTIIDPAGGQHTHRAQLKHDD